MIKRIIAALMCICMTFSLAACGEPSINWDEILLKDILPQIETNKGEILSNTEAEVWLEVKGISEEQYKDYVQLCKDNDFIIDSDEKTEDYTAYNSSGYKLTLFYMPQDKKLDIRMDEPMEIAPIEWPTQRIASSLPIPKSTVGKIEWEKADGFMIYIGETTQEDYNAYVDECIAKGFNVDYHKGDNYYRGDNAEGYNLSVYYEGFNIMSVHLDKYSNESVENSSNLDSADTTSEPLESESQTTSEPAAAISYEEIYHAYQQNELNADSVYKGNRYQVAARIQKIDSNGVWTLGGLLGGAMLTMEVEVDGETKTFKAEFNKDQEESLKTVNVGDSVTFEGECSGSGLWTECKLV